MVELDDESVTLYTNPGLTNVIVFVMAFASLPIPPNSNSSYRSLTYTVRVLVLGTGVYPVISTTGGYIHVSYQKMTPCGGRENNKVARSFRSICVQTLIESGRDSRLGYGKGRGRGCTSRHERWKGEHYL
jgi:hypothetical protein